MSITEEDAGNFDPLAYERGDRIGLCLDIDGTVYRSSSVFIETLAFLPYADRITLTSAERRHRRTALMAVADYHGGPVAKAKWRGLLTGLDALRVGGADHLSEVVLTTLARRRSDRSRRDRRYPPRPASASDAEGYRAMRRAVLSAYGAVLRGRRRKDVKKAVAEVVDRRCAVDPQLRATIDRLTQRADAESYLVTDMPNHVATAYARKLGDDARVVGTSYDTDADGRYTGTFDRVDKRATVARLRSERKWAYVVAAGDAPVDAEMAREANLFLAVAGQSDLAGRLAETDAVSLCESPDVLRSRLAPTRSVVRVPRDESLESALRTVLRAVGVRS